VRCCLGPSGGSACIGLVDVAMDICEHVPNSFSVDVKESLCETDVEEMASLIVLALILRKNRQSRVTGVTWR
jgi:hypothetical protein